MRGGPMGRLPVVASSCRVEEETPYGPGQPKGGRRRAGPQAGGLRRVSEWAGWGRGGDNAAADDGARKASRRQ